MGTILCAVDLTDSAGPVMAVAASLARSFGSRLELLHVVHLPPGLPLTHVSGSLITDIRIETATALEARAAELRATGIDVRTHVVADLIDDAILKRVHDSGAELLVVGTHARRAAARLFLGSVAERVVRAASCPVLVVPPSPAGRLARSESLGGPLKITAGIDLSPASDAALAWLQTVDRRTACGVRLVHLYWPPREHERLGFGAPDRFQANREVVAVLTRELEGHVAAHFGRAGAALRVQPFWGAEDDPLALAAEADDTDLLVVGTSQGRGSTALATVRGSRRPVVCVPSARVGTTPKHLAPVRTVLATTDFSPLGNAAVQEAYRLLLRGGGEVVLLHVAETGPDGLAPDRRSEIEHQLLALVPNGMDVHDVHTRVSVVADHSPGDAIVKVVRRLDPDLVVMSSHGRTGFRHATRGPVTEHVMRASPKPVLVVPASSELAITSTEDQI